MGDLNLWPSDQNHSLVTSKFHDPLGKALTPFTYKANRYGNPRNARIDFIMGNEQAVVTNLDTIHTYASDHYPVIANVALDFSTFSMMHYTINHGANAAGAYNLSAIENEIRNSGADIISLNQVDINFSSRSDYDDQIDLLATRLGMKRSFHATLDKEPDAGSNGKRRKFGQAFLSKFPIESIDDGTQLRWIYTAGATTSTPQGLFGAVININGARTRFYVTSLSTDSISRLQQAYEAKERIAADPLPVKMLSGNLSDIPGSIPLNILQPVFSDAFAGMGSLAFNYPSGTPAKTINYILYSGMLQMQQASVRTSQASTHRPIVTTIKLQ
ncbi:hypothetical protein MKP09_10915 [Niabella ginsengisoli]|uniref:Endonuclease/exonuclease/phosphatase domain-containing protein n=1 Tax=Niabella ginsengisoli TaxID=522298 RepID=A0ABS9SJ57_9BACT|nr:endonuclease/exonuclease/phosphatase family protein [Niabella ginsengisoli]MCH5598385.1 hypothetical protein [Niabella ginsengisoli]